MKMADSDDDESADNDTGGDPGFGDSTPDDEESSNWEDENSGDDGSDGDVGDYDEDEDEDEGRSSTVLFLAIGLGFLIILGGVGFGAWYFIKSDDMQINSQLDVPQEGVLIPPAAESTAEPAETAQTLVDEPAEVAQIAGGASLNEITNVGGLNALADGGLNAATSGGAGATAGLIIPASTLMAYEPYVDYPSPSPLSRAPDPALLQNRDGGEAPLPRIAPDGRTSWEFYARPVEPVEPDSGMKRVAILITGMGLSTAETLAAIKKLPPEITLSFSPYSEDLEQWLLRSRRVGHEVMLGLPLESSGFPVEDPGPLALRTDLSASENLVLTEKLLSLFYGYTGLEVLMGSKFVTSELDVRALLDVLNRRGLMIMDGAWNTDSFIPKVSKELGMPRVKSDLRLDNVMALSAIDAKLKELDALVMTNGQAIATTGMSPAVMDRLKSWILTLADRGIELVPISTLVDLSLPEPS